MYTPQSIKLKNPNSKMAAPPPHITILSIPGLGHLIPLLELSKTLVTLHSFHITFILFPNEPQSKLLNSTTFPSSITFIHLPPLDPSTFSPPPSDPFSLLKLSIKHSLPTIESSILSQSKHTILLVDFFATEALEIAKKLNIPKYIFFASTAALLSFMIYLPVLDREVEGEFYDLPEPIIIPGCTPILPKDIAQPVQNRKHSFYTSFLYIASQFCMADGILVNSSYDLEPKALAAIQDDPTFKEIKTPRVYPVGPLVKNEESVSVVDNICMTWLDKQPAESVLFVSFGSRGFLSAEQITEMAWGLELSQQRFIWVLRRNLEPKDHAGKDNDQSDPLDHLPEGFLDRTKGVGMVVISLAPQVEILKHVATGGFLSHSGWNSTLESVVNGVPIITWPLFAEQRMNATMLVNELKVAIRTVEVEKEGGVICRKEIERVVRLLMESEEGERLRGRVKELQKRLLRGLEEGGTSYGSLTEVVEKWKGYYT